MPSSNLDRLVEARVVPTPEALSAAERKVIDELSEAEIATLIGIRKKLSGELARRSDRQGADAELMAAAEPESTTESEGTLKSNFII